MAAPGRARRRRRREEEEEYALPISMIDVIFQLIIFFMLTLRFRVHEQRLDADLPRDEGQNPIPKEVVPPEEILVKIWLEGKAVQFTVEDHACSSVDDMARKLATIGQSNPNMPVLIDGRQEVPFWAIIAALDACKRARMTNVKFMAPPVPGGGGDDWYYQ